MKLLHWAGSTQDELSSMVEASIKESKISGNDRDVAWDGATMGGQDLQNQVSMGNNVCFGKYKRGQICTVGDRITVLQLVCLM